MSAQIEIFELYLAGEMTPEEREAFEGRLRAEHELQKEFEQYRVTLAHLGAAADMRLKNRLNQIGEKHYAGGNAGSTPSIPLLYRIAASVSIIAIVGYVVYQTSFRTYSTQELYAAYYSPLPVQSFALRNDQADSLYMVWDEAMLRYHQKAYAEAAEPLIHLSKLKDFQLSDPAALYAGISLLELGQPDEAIALLDGITGKHMIRDQAMWFKALALLRLERVEEAEGLIIEINDSPSHYFKESASELLKYFNRIANSD